MDRRCAAAGLALLLSCGGVKITREPAVACSANEVTVDGECLPAACGAGTWGSLPVDEHTIHVDVSAADGGDGTQGAPLTSIQAGVDRAGERGGGLVAVAAGRYVETIAMGDDHSEVMLAGRCKELVVIDASEGEKVPAVGIVGNRKRPGVSIGGLTVAGGRDVGLWVQQATVSATNVDVREVAVAGVFAADTDLAIDQVGVYNTQQAGGEYGFGLYASDGASVQIDRGTFLGNTRVGVIAEGAATTISLEDSEILQTLADNVGQGGYGIQVGDGATLTASASRIEANSAFGLIATGAGTTVRLVDTEVLDTLGNEAGGGLGLDILDGASLDAEGCSVRGNGLGGIYAADPGTTVVLNDTEVRDNTGLGVGIYSGASLIAKGCRLRSNTLVGLVASGSGTSVSLNETDVLDTCADPAGEYGRGVQAQDGAVLTATGSTILRNTEVGVYVSGIGTTVILEDTDVSDTAPDAAGAYGRGISVTDGASLNAVWGTVSGNRDVGLYASGNGTTVTLEDTEVLRTGADVDAESGSGIEVWDGATLSATRCTLRANLGIGMFASGPGSRASLVETQVLQTSSYATVGFGAGVAVADGAALTATGCTLDENSGVGLLALDPGTTAAIDETVILNTSALANGEYGFGVEVWAGAEVTMSGTTLSGNVAIGVHGVGPDTSITLVDSSVLDTVTNAGGEFGYGAHVLEGATLSATGCTVSGNSSAGLAISGQETVVDISGTEVAGTLRGSDQAVAFGVAAQDSARFVADTSRIVSTEGPGLFVATGAEATIDASELAGNACAGVFLLGGSLALTSSTVDGTVPDSQWGGGFGVYAFDVKGPPSLTVLDSVIGPHEYAGIWLDGPGTYDIERNTLSGSEGHHDSNRVLHGNALFAENGVTAWDGTSGLNLLDNMFAGSSEIAVFLDASSATVESNTWSGDGVDVRQQRCEDTVALTREEPDWAEDWDVCPAGNVLTAYDFELTSLYLQTLQTAE